MFGCLFYHLVLFKLFSSVVAVKIAEMIANDYTPCGLIFYSIGLYVHTHLYVENHQYLYHCTEFFDAAVVTQCMYVLYTNIASLFCWSLLIFLPFKQYFAFKLLSPCKILSTHIIFCPHMPFLLNFLLFYFQFHKITVISCNNSFLMFPPNHIFSLNSYFPSPKSTSLRRSKGYFSLLVFNPF